MDNGTKKCKKKTDTGGRKRCSFSQIQQTHGCQVENFVGVFTDHWCLGQGIASTIFRGTSNLEQTDINVCQL